MAKNKSSKNKKPSTELTPEEEAFNSANANWAPGHMTKAMNKIKENLSRVDIVLEVRDARAPLMTSNLTFTDKVKGKPRLIIFNKTNLARDEVITLWKKWLSKQGEKFIFVNALDKQSITQVIQVSMDLLKGRAREAQTNLDPNTTVKMMIIGLPNTGKSTIINTLAGRSITKVADKPGQTQKELWVNVGPGLAILDTPGVLPPTIKNRRQALQLSALNAISERIMDPEGTACYLVEHLLKNNAEEVKAHFKMENLTHDLIDTLNEIAKARGCILKGHEYDYERVYQIVINDFRKGFFGPVSLEHPPLF